MTAFMNYTNGLECRVPGFSGIRNVTVMFEKTNDQVTLQLVSSHNLSEYPKRYSCAIPYSEFQDRPRDPYNKASEAIWALDKLGLRPAALD